MPRLVVIVSLLGLALFPAILGHAMPAAVAQEATPDTECPMSSEDENEAVARLWYDDVLNGADMAVLDEILSPDFIYHSGTISEMNSRELADVVLAPILVGFPDVAYTVEEAITDDDFVVLIWRGEGTHTGEFQGYAPSGNAATWTGINAYRFECGRIAEVWAEFDALGRLRQLGLLGTPTP
jgi:steroid delta-isomerase-like uncharacterized protein